MHYLNPLYIYLLTVSIFNEGNDTILISDNNSIIGITEENSNRKTVRI